MDGVGRADPEWDERLWNRVWERNLTQVERYNTAVSVLRHRPPGTAFEDIVARELAHRLRRRSLAYAGVYALWTLFWGALALLPWPDDLDRPALPTWCFGLGLLAIALCLVARRHFGAYLSLADTVEPD